MTVETQGSPESTKSSGLRSLFRRRFAVTSLGLSLTDVLAIPHLFERLLAGDVDVVERELGPTALSKLADSLRGVPRDDDEWLARARKLHAEAANDSRLRAAKQVSETFRKIFPWLDNGAAA